MLLNKKQKGRRQFADPVKARVLANLKSTIAIQTEGSSKPEKAFALKSLPLLVAGDEVLCHRDEQVLRVHELIARKSVLERADRYRVKPLAANLTHLGIVSANPPGIDTLLIDQFCVAAHRAEVSALIIFNKSDRMSVAERESAIAQLDTYRRIGYPAVMIDTKTEKGLQPLLDELSLRSITLVGASGVGKSSIIQKLLPDRELRIGAVSEATGIGAHTTSVTYWYQLPNGGSVIDSPGVRQYSVAHLDERAVRDGFIEISDTSTRCRFGDCTHTVEPACAVRESVENREIAVERYQNYCKLISR